MEKKLRQIVLDTETTGLSAETGTELLKSVALSL
jgi:DNA polymerase III epsilon subunit-like protein